MPNEVSDFITRLLTNLKSLVGNDKFGESVREARAYAGGVAKAKKQKGQASEGAPTEGTRRLFLSEIQFSEDRKTGYAQIFPTQGSYSHPWYGDLNLDEQFFTDIKRNFDERVYQQDIPITINLEHESSLSGAVGWFTEIELREEGLGADHKYTGVWARIKFNDRGAEFVGGDQYRYFSSEFYQQWADPATNKVYTNVLVGGALTNHPFFKGMEPVALLTEARVYAFAEIEPFEDVFEEALGYLVEHPDASLGEVVDALLKTRDQGSEGEEGPAADADAAPEQGAADQEEVARAPLGNAAAKEKGMNEEEIKAFNEMKAAFAEAQAKIQAAEQKAAEADARAMRVERADNRRKLGEFVRENREGFKGEVEEVVDRLEKLQAKLSEDEWTAFVDERKEIAASVRESLAFRQVAREGAASGEPQVNDALEVALKPLIAGGMPRHEAVAKVLSENPGIYEKANQTQNRRAVYAERPE